MTITRVDSLQRALSDRSAVLDGWLRQQLAGGSRQNLIGDRELRSQSEEFLGLLAAALERGGEVDARDGAWADVRSFLADVSRGRAEQGLTPSEAAAFIFSLKEPLFEQLRSDLAKDPRALAEATFSMMSAARIARAVHDRGAPARP